MPTRGSYVPPLAIFVAASLLVAVGAGIAGFSPLDVHAWARWDSFHYVNIALFGYDQGPVPCDAERLACEHAGWLPGYPAAYALPAQLGLSATTSGLIVSWLCGAGSLYLLWTRFLAGTPAEARWACLLFAGAVPGMVYQHTVFPLSMLTLFTLLCLWMLARDRLLGAGLSGAVAAATYPLGVLLAPLATVSVAVVRRARGLRGFVTALGTGALILAGFGAVLVFQYLEVGEWLGYFEVQEHPLRNPLAGLRAEFTRDLRETDAEYVVAAQAALSTGLAGALVVLLARRRERLTRLDVLASVFALAAWLLPLTQTDVSTYRSHAAMLPAAPLLRHMPAPVRWGFVAWALALAMPMSVLFFKGSLV